MEHRIGDIITLPDGRKAKVVEGEFLRHCKECIFYDTTKCEAMQGGKYGFARALDCYGPVRNDETSVFYKEIKED